MEEFKGLIRDTQPHRNPSGSWHFARNIIKRGGSIKNEDGIKLIEDIGGIFIGIIPTNRESVLFSKFSGHDEIGILKSVESGWEYVPVLRGKLDFSYNCPIEGIFIYNHKKELVVLWSDGIKKNSSVPKLLNLTKLPFEVDANLYPINNYSLNLIKTFPDVNQGRIETTRVGGGDVRGNVAFVTYCYVFDDNSTTLWFPLSEIVYTASGYDPVTRNGFIIDFYNLDKNFNKIKIGIVVKEDGQLSAYQSPSIEYTDVDSPDALDLTFSLTSTSSFETIGVEELVIAKDIFQKIRTITKQNNEVLVGNTHKREHENLQKYISKLELSPILTQSVDKDRYLEACFSPDEVYSLWCEVQWLDGSYSEAYHIPGNGDPQAVNVPLSPTDRIDLNLQDAPVGAMRFHYINNGDFPTSGSLIGTFGYWRNEEVYPDKPEFDSTDVGGEDLRGTHIRYHRFPGYDNLHSKEWLRQGLPQRIDSDSLDEDTNSIRMGLVVENFNTIFPLEIKDQIQGYRISFIKRTFGDSLVVGHSMLFSASTLKLKDIPNDSNIAVFDIDTIHPLSLNFLGESPQGGLAATYEVYNGFSYGALISSEIYKNRPKTTITHVKANYILGVVDSWRFPDLSSWMNYDNIPKVDSHIIPSSDKFAIVKDQLKYLPANNFAVGTGYQEETNRIRFERANWKFFSPNTNIKNHNWLVPLVTLFQLKVNLYPGFRSSDLVTLGRTDEIDKSNVEFYGGDMFTSSSIDVSLYSTTSINYDNIRSSQLRLKFKGLAESINERQMYNLETPYSSDIDKNGDIEVKWDEFPDRSYEITFKGEEDLSTINDISTILTWTISDDFVTRFPFRVNRGVKIPSENITTNSLRSFLVSRYYDMPNDKGEIVALRGSNSVLYIQQEFALFAASVKDLMKGGSSEDVYLGVGDIFDRAPQEIVPDGLGYIGSISQFACKMFKGGLITIDSLKGKIFIVSQGLNEVSAKGMRDYFYHNSQLTLDLYELDDDKLSKKILDNPYISNGYLTAYDEENNRLLITKKLYIPKYTVEEFIDLGIETDGQFYYARNFDDSIVDFNDTRYFNNLSKTFSLDLMENGNWVAEHDYFPNIIYSTNEGLFSINNRFEIKVDDPDKYSATIFKHNDKDTKGLYYGKKFDSYVDLIFNTENQVSKIYKALQWITEVVDSKGKRQKDKTVTSIIVYNYDQCTGTISLKDKQFELIRDSNYSWKFNSIRDMVVNKSLPIIDSNGDIEISNLNFNKPFFEKKNFIGKFVIVRLIYDNEDNNDIYIHSVNVNSLKIR